MKQRTSFAWLFALAFGAGLTFSSCKDDVTSNGGLTPEEQMDKGSERAEALLSVLSMTAGVDSLPNDWYKADYTVEPTVGKVIDSSNPYVRYVAVNSIEEADKEYKSMFSGDVTGTVKDDTWTKDGIGTLTFTVKNQPDVTATVDVNVQQLPHLTQIRFVPPSVIGENSNFKSYYHFGDVVRLKADNSYWICVRPTSSADGKNLSHWVSFGMNASNAQVNPNFKTYTKSGVTLTLPYSLGDKSNSEKHIPDFFNLYKALHENLRTIIEQNQGIRPNVNKEKYTIGGVDLPVDLALEISDFWRGNKFWTGDLIPENIQSALNIRTKRKEEMDVFYFGHHYWVSPDVHMLKICCPNESYDVVSKPEIKFAYPTANTSFEGYSNKGESKACTKLTIKTQNETLPEQGFVMRYKSGPELSGKSNLLRNDKDPEVSFTTYSTLVEDVYVYKKMKEEKDKECGYFSIGDQVTKDSKPMVCVKSTVGAYNTAKRSLFILLGKDESEPVAIEKDESYVIAVNLLNSYLLKENAFIENKENSLGANYKASLTELGNCLDKLTEVYGKSLEFENLGKDQSLSILYYINQDGAAVPYKYNVKYSPSLNSYIIQMTQADVNDKKNVIRVSVYQDGSEEDQGFVDEDEEEVKISTSYDRKKAKIEAAQFYNKSKMSQEVMNP